MADFQAEQFKKYDIKLSQKDDPEFCNLQFPVPLFSLPVLTHNNPMRRWRTTKDENVLGRSDPSQSPLREKECKLQAVRQGTGRIPK